VLAAVGAGVDTGVGFGVGVELAAGAPVGVGVAAGAEAAADGAGVGVVDGGGETVGVDVALGEMLGATRTTVTFVLERMETAPLVPLAAVTATTCVPRVATAGTLKEDLNAEFPPTIAVGIPAALPSQRT
jgi:hypothetical protein